MKNDFNFCPSCGKTRIVNHNNRKWTCPDCGFDLYCNVAAAVGVIISDAEKNVLFEVRAKEPRKGFLALPGGFVDPDESAENAIKRECQEEIGADVTDVQFLCTNPNDYEYKGIAYKTCDIFFTASLAKSHKDMQTFVASLKRQESEVTGFEYVKIQTLDDVKKLPLAFESARKTLEVWLRWNQK